MKSHLFLGLDFFYKMLGQNKTKGNKKLFIAKKARIRACPDLEVTRTAMAHCLGRQGREELTKENLAGPSVFMPKRITRIIKSGEK
jgi:hypothetical protein